MLAVRRVRHRVHLSPECPVSVHSCSQPPVSHHFGHPEQQGPTHLRHRTTRRVASQILTVLSLIPHDGLLTALQCACRPARTLRSTGIRVPRQRALLLMDQTRTSASVHAAANDRAMSNHDTHLLACLRIPDLHGVVTDPLTMCLPSGEYATESTWPECPVSVHSCSTPLWLAILGHPQSNKADHPMGSRTSSPVVAFQILTELSVEIHPSDGRPDALAMCLPSGENETDQTGSECPVSVHFCSWPNPARQHSARSSK